MMENLPRYRSFTCVLGRHFCRWWQVLAAEDTPGWEAYQQRIFEAWSGLDGVLEPPKPHWRAHMLDAATCTWQTELIRVPACGRGVC